MAENQAADRAAKPAVEEYERLGGKKLKLVDVLAQSVGFIGPVFSAAFIIPFDHRRERARRRGPGRRRRSPSCSRRSACSRSAGSSRSTRSGSTRRARCTTTSRTASARRSEPRGLAVLRRHDHPDDRARRAARRVRARQPRCPTLRRSASSRSRSGSWDVIFAALLFVVLYLGVQISTRVQLTLALISIAVVLIFFITVIVRARAATTTSRRRSIPSPSPDGARGDPVRRAVRRADLRRVRDGGEPRGGDRGAQALDPEGGARCGRDRVDLLPHRGLRRGRGLRLRPVRDHEPARWPAPHCSRSASPGSPRRARSSG